MERHGGVFEPPLGFTFTYREKSYTYDDYFDGQCFFSLEHNRKVPVKIERVLENVMFEAWDEFRATCADDEPEDELEQEDES